MRLLGVSLRCQHLTSTDFTSFANMMCFKWFLIAIIYISWITITEVEHIFTFLLVFGFPFLKQVYLCFLFVFFPTAFLKLICMGSLYIVDIYLVVVCAEIITYTVVFNFCEVFVFDLIK